MRMFYFLIAVMINSPATAQFPYQPLPMKQSDFKKIKELNFTKLFIYEMVENEKILHTEVEYGDQGLMAAMYKKGTNDNGDSINTVETYFKFDGKGKLIRETETDIENGNGEVVSVFTYDAAGKLIKRQIVTIDPPTYKYKYDTKGRLVEANVTQLMPVYDAKGEFHGKSKDIPSSTIVYKYDAKGRLSELWDFTISSGAKEKTPNFKLIYNYNEKNELVKLRRFNQEGTEMSIETYEYDKDGLIKTSAFNDGDVTTRLVYEYCKGCKQSWK